MRKQHQNWAQVKMDFHIDFRLDFRHYLLAPITESAYATTSTADRIKYRNELFDTEQKRQLDQVGRIEKIEVRYLGLPEDTTLIMNKAISTPYNCAQREYSFS